MCSVHCIHCRRSDRQKRRGAHRTGITGDPPERHGCHHGPRAELCAGSAGSAGSLPEILLPGVIFSARSDPTAKCDARVGKDVEDVRNQDTGESIFPHSLFSDLNFYPLEKCNSEIAIFATTR